MLLIIAFLFDFAWLAPFVAAVMLVGTILPKAGLFKWFYQALLKPAGLLKPDVKADASQPHLFAQGIGGLFLLAATLAFVLGAPVVGWILCGIVVALAAVNLFFGFCAGCFMYFQLGRLGIHPQLPTWEPLRAK